MRSWKNILFLPLFLVSTALQSPDDFSPSLPANPPPIAPTILPIADLSPEVIEHAMVGYSNLVQQDALARPQYLTICDMSQSANRERLYLIDMFTGELVHQSLVAHGKGSGEEYASVFSNREGSHQTSLGFYVTAETYEGKHGLSLRLDGLEQSNNRARDRAIVIHSAQYVSDDFIQTYGRLGRSFGCPSLPVEGYNEVIDLIANGTCLFVYYPQSDYLDSSPLLRS